MADHRLRKRPSEHAGDRHAAIAAELLLTEARARGSSHPGRSARSIRSGPASARRRGASPRRWRATSRAGARRASSSRGSGQPPAVHALAHLMNAALRSDRAAWTHRGDLDHGRRRRAGPHGARRGSSAAAPSITLVLLESNVVYTAPAGSRARGAAPLRPEPRSTSGSTRTRPPRAATGSCPPRHDLEAWGDARAYDGTSSLIQRAHRARSSRAGPPPRCSRCSRARRRRARATSCATPGPRAGAAPISVMRSGRTRSGAGSSRTPRPRARGRHAAARRGNGGARAARGGGRPRRRTPSRSPSRPTRASMTAGSPTTRGSSSCPIPMTKLTWDNAALHHRPATASARRREQGCRRVLDSRGRTMTIPRPPSRRGTPTAPCLLALGYGRSGAESIPPPAWGQTRTGSDPRPRPCSRQASR